MESLLRRHWLEYASSSTYGGCDFQWVFESVGELFAQEFVSKRILWIVCVLCSFLVLCLYFGCVCLSIDASVSIDLLFAIIQSNNNAIEKLILLVLSHSKWDQHVLRVNYNAFYTHTHKHLKYNAPINR